jgi:threonine aldolase
MVLHMDGARLANAAVTLNQNLRQATRDLGVDVLSFGGTKNGLMGSECVIFFSRQLLESKEFAQNFLYLRKQAMQLASKMRFVAAQMETLLSRDLWLDNARNANRMAKLLEQKVRQIPGVRIVYRVEANGVFAQIPKPAIERLQKQYFFYVWDEEQSVVRWMCSFDTTEQDVEQFAECVRAAVQS